MSEGFEEYPTLPGFDQMFAQRIASKAAPSALPPPGTADPYELMVKRKEGGQAELPLAPTQQWPEEDVKALEDYCKRNGILGFATRQNPKLALMQLKRQVGDYSGVPLEDRVPEGYERRGTPNKYGPGYPYSEAVAKKQVLHG